MDAAAYLRGHGRRGGGRPSRRPVRGCRGAAAGRRWGSSAVVDDRDHARPRLQRVVLLVVERRPRADLRRRLVDRQREHGRGLQLLLGRRAHLRPAPGHDVLDDRLQRGELLAPGTRRSCGARAASPSGSWRSGAWPSARAPARRAARPSGRAGAPAGERAQRAAGRRSRAGRRRRRGGRAASGSRTAGRRSSAMPR